MATYPVNICDAVVDVSLPAQWKVNYAPIKERPALTEAQIRAALASPIGTPPIRELARGKKKAVIIVEDVTRPLRGEELVPHVIEEIHAGGIAYADIMIIIGIGAHRPMAQREYRRKLGDKIVDNFLVVNNNCYENQVYVGDTPAGTPVDITKDVAEADLRLTVGATIPHNVAGYTGGGKLILPGVCSMRTISHHHAKWGKESMSFGSPENGFRLEIEAAARVAHVDAIVEALMNSQAQAVGLFVGDLVAAHRAACKEGEQIYTAAAPAGVDVVITSGFPRDIELGQGMACLGAHSGSTSVREGGAVLYMAGAQEGVGFHSLRDKNRGNRARPPKRAYDLVVYAPQLSPREAAEIVPEGTKIFDKIDEAIALLAAAYPQATCNVFPQGAMTIFKPL